jgi:sterol desaturase/sphingolipid hydroxylase (fatty acid hydroxylase superfamily)
VKQLLLDLVRSQGPDFWKVQVSAMVAFFCLCVTEGVVTRRPLSAGPPPGLATDMYYWLLIPTVRMASRLVVAALLVFFGVALGLRTDPQLLDGFGPLARQPMLLIIVELLVLMDLLSYWSHRLFHKVPLLWRFHAIHHSATSIRWSTTGRVHPVNEIINYAVTIVPCFLLGFPINVVLPLTPVMVIYAVAAHTQWNPSFGPLRCVFASPRFHRWHHTLSHEGGNMNFSNVFSFWDALFGTFYLPPNRLPETFGLDHDQVPERYLAQLAFPFRRPADAVTASPEQPTPSFQPAARGSKAPQPLGPQSAPE